MKRSKYLTTIHEGDDGNPFVVLESRAGWERRGRRAGGRILVETWSRVDSVDLSPESLSVLHALAEARLDGKR